MATGEAVYAVGSQSSVISAASLHGLASSCVYIAGKFTLSLSTVLPIVSIPYAGYAVGARLFACYLRLHQRHTVPWTLLDGVFLEFPVKVKAYTSLVDTAHSEYAATAWESLYHRSSQNLNVTTMACTSVRKMTPDYTPAKACLDVRYDYYMWNSYKCAIGVRVFYVARDVRVHTIVLSYL